ncbi:MAG: iron export ABC transporter permease subunit FetB [Actinobacteria bacterium]|nr:iron export ABC transporter permease subunit FetB [Actinomycetota bacterium]
MARRGVIVIQVAISVSLVALAIAASLSFKLRLERDLMIATLRALVQMVGVAYLIHLVFDSLALTGIGLAVMASAATWTSARRLKGVPHSFELALVSISSGTLVSFAILFGAGVFPLEPQWMIPIAGMLIGNTMIVTSLAGARIRDEVVDKTLEVEARLALGVPAKEAMRGYVRRAATAAMIPIVDTTKNVGLIHLPGAFVGMMLGGAEPLEAAKVQLIVLFMLLGAVAVSGITTAVLAARSFVAPGERIAVPAGARAY